MSTFLQKVRLITLGAVHDLLDRKIDMNSPSVLRQYTRDLEDALEKMHNETAIAGGRVRTLKREAGDLESRIASGTSQIQRLLASTDADRENRAREQGSVVVRLQQTLETNKQELVSAVANLSSLETAVANLEAKHRDIVERVRDLERLDRSTKSMEAAADALNQAGRLVQSGADVSVDDVQARMRERNDVATEKFTRAMGDIRTEEDPAHRDAVDDLLNSLRSADAKEPAPTAA